MCKQITTTTTKTRSVKIMDRDEANNAYLLRITENGREDFYFVCEIPSDFGRCFNVFKHGSTESSYDVCIDGAASSCECKGHLRWNHCKHLECLQALIKAKKI